MQGKWLKWIEIYLFKKKNIKSIMNELDGELKMIVCFQE